MRLSITLLQSALVTLSSATPRHHHNHKHHEVNYVSVSGKPFPLGNSTFSVLATASERHIPPSTTALAAITISTATTDETPSPENDSVKEKAVVEQGTGPVNACELVTVTHNPIVTITVSPSANQVAPVDAYTSSARISSVPMVHSEILQTSATPSGPSPSYFVSVSTQKASNPAFVSASQVANPEPKTPSLSPPSSTTQVTNPESEAPSKTSSSIKAIDSQSTTASALSNGLRTKRGIIASGSDQKLLVSALTPFNKISWLGDWYSGPPTNLPPSIQFVPQNYGRQSDVNGEWTSNAKKAVAANDKYFLSFGEPGTPNAQLYMDPEDAVKLFMQEMQPYAVNNGVSIGAPGTLQNDQDFAWLSSFLDSCDKAGCKIEFLAMHWFWTAEADHIQGFKDTLKRNIDLANGKPVWIDNFQAAGTVAAQKEFLKEVVPWLDDNDAVARYAYVPVDRGNGEGFLNDGDGTLSELGEFYATL